MHSCVRGLLLGMGLEAALHGRTQLARLQTSHPLPAAAVFPEGCFFPLKGHGASPWQLNWGLPCMQLSLPAPVGMRKASWLSPLVTSP